jgi:hypothetical protein
VMGSDLVRAAIVSSALIALLFLVAVLGPR